MAHGSKRGACSSNTQTAKGNCLDHNRRTQKKVPNYVNQNLTHNNRTVFEDELIKDRKSIVSLVKQREKLYTEKTGQKCQKSFAPFRESVLHIKEGVTDEQLMNFKTEVEAATGWKVIGIWVHEDEGYYHSKYIEGDEKFEINHHAHVLFDCQNLETGKAIRADRKKLSLMQDILAKCVGMERGNRAAETGKRHRSAMQERITRQEQRIEELQSQIDKLSIAKEAKEGTIEGIKSFFGTSSKDKRLKAQEEQIKAQEAKIKQLTENNKLLTEEIKQKQKEVLQKAIEAIDYEKKKARLTIQQIEAKVMEQKNQINQLVEILMKKSPSLSKAVDAMLSFVHGIDELPTPTQINAVNKYLAETNCDTGMTPKDTIERRKIGVQDISMASINVCGSGDLLKMDRGLRHIAEVGPDEVSPYKDFSLRIWKNPNGEYFAQVSHGQSKSEEFQISSAEGAIGVKKDYEGRKMREKIIRKLGETPEEVRKALRHKNERSRGMRI